MDVISNLFLILGFTLVITFISFYVFGVKGPWGNFWVKSLLLFLFLLATSLWIKPVGPTWYGIQWLVLFIGALLFILLLVVFSPPSDEPPKIPSNISLMKKKRLVREYLKERTLFFFSMGMMFWLLFTVLVIIIAFGYYLT